MDELVTIWIAIQTVSGLIGAWWVRKQFQMIKNLPNQFAEILGNFGKNLQSAKMSDLGKLSGEARGFKALANDELLKNLAGTDSNLDMILDNIPEVKKYVTKYPFLAPIIKGLAQKYLASMGNPQSAPNQPKASNPEDIKRLQAGISLNQ